MLFLFETYSMVLYENKSAKKNMKHHVVKDKEIIKFGKFYVPMPTQNHQKCS